MIIWHRAQLAVVDKSYMQRTQRSCLTSRLPCVWLAVSNAYFPVLSRKPSESVKTKISTAHISKTKTNFSKIPSKLFSGLAMKVSLSWPFSWPLKNDCHGVFHVKKCGALKWNISRTRSDVQKRSMVLVSVLSGWTFHLMGYKCYRT